MMDPSGMYILPARCIKCPLLVVPDIEAKDTVSLTNYLAVLPRHKMGAYWTYYVQQHVTNEEGDEVTTAQDKEDEKMYGNEW
jgi:guanyl-specific ribonuclease Sa